MHELILNYLLLGMHKRESGGCAGRVRLHESSLNWLRRFESAVVIVRKLKRTRWRRELKEAFSTEACCINRLLF